MRKALIISWLLMIVAVLYLVLIEEIAGFVFLLLVGLTVFKSRKEELWA